MKISASLAVVFAVAMGCGGDDITVGSVTSKGSVGGILVDAATRLPLADVEVSLLAGGKLFGPKTTDELGAFRFTSVPGGGVIVSVTAPDGYTSAFIRGELPTAAGEYPSGNATLTLGPIGLVPASQAFRFRVLDENGAPVEGGYSVGVQTSVQYVDFASGAANAEGEVFRSVQTDPDGYVVVPGMPDYFALGAGVPDSVLVFLPPRDANGDGLFEFPGGDASFNLRSLADPTPDVILDANLAASLVVRASTIPQLVGGGAGTPALVQTNDQLHVTFNLPIQANVDIQMFDEDGGAIGVPSSALGITDDTLAINLGGLGLASGAEYNVSIHAVAAVGERFAVGDFAASFFTRTMDPNVSVASIVRDAGTQVVTITFNEPVGFGNVGSNSTLSGGNCVVFFAYDVSGGGTGTIGDAANELGSGSCNISFSSNEPDPPGAAIRSGYATRWQFTAPQQGGAGGNLPGGITGHLQFSRVPSTGSVTERVDGRAVEDLTFTLP